MNTDPQMPSGNIGKTTEPRTAADTNPAPVLATHFVSGRWRHSYGEMLIVTETRTDGTVRINGEVVDDTVPPCASRPVQAP